MLNKWTKVKFWFEELRWDKTPVFLSIQYMLLLVVLIKNPLICLCLHQGSCVSFELCVIIGSINNTFHFLHVGFPVYLSVWKYKYCNNKS